MPDYYTASGDPSTDSAGESAVIRAEFTAIAAGISAKLAPYTGNASKIVAINGSGTAQEAITTTGTGSGVRATTPTLVTPVLGVATATSINKVAFTAPATSATLTIADGKTLTASNTLTFSGTDGSTLNIGTGGTAAILGANTFAGAQTFSGAANIDIPGTAGFIQNLKLAVNASVNKLDVFSKSGGAAPDASNIIGVAIPDGTGNTSRTRAASYLSGTNQFILADATDYWTKGSLDAELKNAYVYAIWDGTGIIFALAGYAGFDRVPTTTTVTDDDYFLLEASSTYTRSNSHYCVCIGRIRYEYDVAADTLDHTIQASVENGPKVLWNPKSDYGYQRNLANTVSQGTDIAEYSAVGITVKQTGWYLAVGQARGRSGATTSPITCSIRAGSATYGSAVLKAAARNLASAATSDVTASVTSRMYLAEGSVIHLGAAVDGSGTRTLFGDGDVVGGTALTFMRVD